jgi:hypothetical protein
MLLLQSGCLAVQSFDLSLRVQQIYALLSGLTLESGIEFEAYLAVSLLLAGFLSGKLIYLGQLYLASIYVPSCHLLGIEKQVMTWNNYRKFLSYN